MDLFKRKTKQEKPQLKPGALAKHIKLSEPRIIEHFDDDLGVCSSYINQYYLAAVDSLDSKICEKIIEIAKESGINDVLLLDKKNIARALNKAIPQKEALNANGLRCCPVCSEVLLPTSRYCDICGQSIKRDSKAGESDD